MASVTTTDDRVSAVRAFNRFYTTVIGLLGEGMHSTRYSLTEARVIFELGQRSSTEVAELRRELDLDAGYVSRILARFEADGLVGRGRSTADRRRQVVGLTKRGRAAFATLDRRSTEQIRALLSPLDASDQGRLVAAMGAISGILEPPPPAERFVLREPRPGDFGWVVSRHGAVYTDQYGWDETFEALVARIVADYVEDHDPQLERAWIAELDGDPAGCIFCVEREPGVAQLRLLLVEPRARGLGIGTALLDRCVAFAREAGYERIMLWTQSVLEDARRIYERAGFELAAEEPHRSFGHDLVGQDLWLSLASPPRGG